MLHHIKRSDYVLEEMLIIFTSGSLLVQVLEAFKEEKLKNEEINYENRSGIKYAPFHEKYRVVVTRAR